MVTTPIADNPEIVRVTLNRPHKRNAIDGELWDSIGATFARLSECPKTRVVVLDAAGDTFTAGIDLSLLMSLAPQLTCAARNARAVRRLIVKFQEAFTQVEQCEKPVIAAVHGRCIGAGVDLLSACDVRYAAASATFSIKEVAVGLAADVGTLQRLPKIVGNHSLLRELALTGRDFSAAEAQALGMVSRVFESPEALNAGALELAQTIASHSPIAVTGTKRVLNYSRDHTVQEGLEYVANWNMAMLQSGDLLRALQASMAKEKPIFPALDKDE